MHRTALLIATTALLASPALAWEEGHRLRRMLDEDQRIADVEDARAAGHRTEDLLQFHGRNAPLLDTRTGEFVQEPWTAAPAADR